MPDTRFPWPLIPLPGSKPPGDRIYRTPDGEPLNPDGGPIDPRELLPTDEGGSTPVEDARETGGSGSDEVFDLREDTGLIPDAPPGTMVPLPDPGSIDWSRYGVIYPGDGPVLIERGTRTRPRRRVGRLIPHGLRREGGLPPALERGRLGAGNPRSLREVGQTQPRAGQLFPALPGSFAPTDAVRFRPRDRRPRSRLAESLLAWQRPRVEPVPRRSPRRGPRVKPGRDPFVWPRRRRKADEPLRPARRARPPIIPPIRKVPPGQPDWTSPFPPSPRKLPPPRPAPSKQPLPSPPLEVPRPAPKQPVPKTPAPRLPRIPIPGFPSPAPGPSRAPAPKRRPIPRPARLPLPGFPVPIPSSPSTQPRTFPWPRIEPSISPLPLPSAPPQTVTSPLPSPSPSPTPFPSPLTRFNADPLPFLNPKRARERDRDRCKEPTPNPSNVIAKVKAYGRRMSKNSLDNLRRR
jgi:hypothetical protein